MKKNKISTKIKLIGFLFIVLMISIITTTIYLNDKNKKDALTINIVGKQRMLTQNITKNIFYLYQHKNASMTELDNSTTEFIYNLNTLIQGNKLSKIQEAPTRQIANQLVKVDILWKSFHENIVKFKELLQKNDKDSLQLLDNVVNSIYLTNSTLLNEVDNLVSIYTIYSEEKLNNLQYIQYLFAFLILLLMIYSFIQLRTMEDNVKKFLEESEKIVKQSFDEPLTPIKLEGENEIIEMSRNINCFVDKINSVMSYSTNAIEQSKNASLKLDELNAEFDNILDELTNSPDIAKQLNKSEDIFIQSQEHLINSTRRLQDLKKELENIVISCKVPS
ncbi:type IV pili methyl-accepting chemotaxis transducer N-terminal domain-containing protein [Aliarcobacter butzleri]